jgi:arylsulfatase A-like enzyme
LLFGLYPAIGAILTSGLALLVWVLGKRLRSLAKLDAGQFLPAAGIFTVILLFALNLAGHVNEGRVPLFAIFVAIVLCLALAGRIVGRQVSFIANSWTAGFLLLGIVFLPQYAPVSTFIWRVTLVAAYITAILVASYAIHKMLPAMIMHAARRGAQSVSFAGCCALVFLGISVALDRGLYISAPVRLAQASMQGRPNIVFIVLDTVRADHLSLYGYHRDTTPHLKQLAADAATYNRAIATSDWTLPSHASMFTGLYASEHGAYCDKSRLFLRVPNDVTTLAEALYQQGYATAAVVANIAMVRDLNLHQGFQYYAVRLPATALSAANRRFILRTLIMSLARRFKERPANPQFCRSATDITQEVVAMLDQFTANTSPFFLFANYMDAHSPYKPPAPYETLYSSSETMPLRDYYGLSRKVMRTKRRIAPAVREHLKSKYDGALSYLDHEIGRLVDHLKRIGIYDNTLIVITADNGEAFGEHDLMQHGVFVYRDQVHVPLLIKWPRTRGSRRVDEVVSGVDMMPTILEAAGGEIPEGISGRSLLRQGDAAPRVVLSETYPCPDILRLHSRFNRVERAVRSGQWKFIQSTAGKRELFDMQADPFEMKNLHAVKKSTAAEMERTLTKWIARLKPQSRIPARLDREALDRLKALGYVQ